MRFNHSFQRTYSTIDYIVVDKITENIKRPEKEKSIFDFFLITILS